MATRWRPSAPKSQHQAKESTVDDWENDDQEDEPQQGESGQTDHDSEAWPTLNGAAAMGPKILKRDGTAGSGLGSNHRPM